MAALVIVLRIVSLLAFAAPMLLAANGRRGRARTRALQHRGDQAPAMANFAAFGAFVISLLMFSGGAEGTLTLLFASSGSLLAVAGAIVVLKSRAALGAAWSFVPTTDEGAGFIRTGPYRLVRHPIYLGLALLAIGQALAFSSWPAFLVAVCGIVPTFAWRARAEEALLRRTFGDRYAIYQNQTRMIIPHLF
jgi:protein-S-isoprenylcysteine O-methyltransferase Ste14